MYLIVGLGNPGKKYEQTRHNMGFAVLDIIAEKANVKYKTKGEAEYLKTEIAGHDAIIIKPQTFMNLSGRAVNYFQKYFRISEEKTIIIYDDKDTDIGEIRIRKSGSSGGHNGIKDILRYTTKFVRIRVGIGRPDSKRDMINHVLEKVSSEEYQKLEEGIKKAYKAVEDIIKMGTDKAMNINNIKKTEKSEEK